ncbi:MAG: NUDIX domain-containing protein, partial [Mycobacteriales bacterium]
GGLDEGETFAEAAARELSEETGLVVAPAELGERVLERQNEFRWNGGHYLQSEEYFLLRVDSHVVDESGLSPLEVSCFVEHRWWDLDALAATPDVIYPTGLPELLGELGI